MMLNPRARTTTLSLSMSRRSLLPTLAVAALLQVAGCAKSLRDGADLCQTALGRGEPYRLLERLRQEHT